LRDHGQDTASRDPANGQKLLTATDIDPDTRIDSARVTRGRLSLTFEGGVSTWIDLQWLQRLSTDPRAEPPLIPDGRHTWGSALDPEEVIASYPDIRDNPGSLAKWLAWVDTHGFARLRQVPATPDALFEVIDLFGFVRETNYGRLFEVRSEPEPTNLAYTRVGLDPHTDNPYRDPTPTLQILHCLENTTSGGESCVVDGFRLAEILQRESPYHFSLLSRYPVTFRYHGDGKSDLNAVRPMLEMGPDGSLQQVRINNRAFHALSGIPFAQVTDFYAAYRHLVEISRRSDVSVSFRMQSGDLFIVDNTRVLHGRKGFTEQGRRWFQGAYADIDGLRSTLRVLRGGSAE
jgi:gamma-butyrobetaine dioxygenase